jgi:exopolyphosphatase / guanosine-5'-triphosphate,3'-diphosphate pyrophosphatase
VRVAAIDIGTNTVLLLVAERGAEGLVAVEERATITRLGEGVDKTRALAAGAIARTAAALDDYGELVARLGVSRIDVVGTSAMRDAAGGDGLRDHVRRVFGVEARTISGDEEARLTFAGAQSGLASIPAEAAVRVFDIGGGSTEIVHGRGDAIAFARSFDVGSVRLTERHVRTDPPSRSEIEALREDARRAFDVPPFESAHPPIGIAGTMTTLAAVSLALEPYDGARVHGLTMRVNALEEVVRALEEKPLTERSKVAGLEPKRADVIVAGGHIALAYLETVGAQEVVISDRGVRWGLAEQLAS